MLIHLRTNVYLQQLSLFSWFFLSSVFLLNSLSSTHDSWIQLCTQKGVLVVNVSQQSEGGLHKADPCQCISDDLVHSSTLAIANGSAAQSLSQYYEFHQISLAYSPLNPRAPPFNIAANV